MTRLEVNEYLENETIILSYIIEYCKMYINISDTNKKTKEKVLLQLINANVGSIGYNPNTSIFYETRKKLKDYNIDIIIERIYSTCSAILFNEKFKEDYIKDSEIILLDFLNFTFKLNEYDNKLTLKDLYKKYEKDQYINKLEELKEFLMDVELYSKSIKETDTIERFIERFFKNSGRKLDDKTFKFFHDSIDYDLSVLIYAYSKSKKYKFKSIKKEIIKNKILEMKKRD